MRHNAIHVSYASWCPICVKAGGIDDRRHVKHTEKLETVVQFDYMFVTGGKEPAKDPDQKVEKEYDALTVLVGVDRASGAIFSVPCPRRSSTICSEGRGGVSQKVENRTRDGADRQRGGHHEFDDECCGERAGLES